MKNARAFWIRPIAETPEAEHHLNRRADIVIQDAGGCDSCEVLGTLVKMLGLFSVRAQIRVCAARLDPQAAVKEC